jgi:hypothetical protein
MTRFRGLLVRVLHGRGLRLLAPAVAVAVCAVLVGAPAFSEGSPWWHLLSVSRPSNLDAAEVKDAVWEVSATTEEFEVEPGVTVPSAAFTLYTVTNGRKTVVGKFASEGLANSATGKSLGLEVASAANVQSALESRVGYRVGVTGGPGGSAPLVATFVDQVGPTLEAEALIAGASATQTAVGESSGDEVVAMADDVGDADVNGASSPAVVSDVLPAGLKAVAVSARVPEGDSITAYVPLECSIATVSCSFPGVLPAFDQIEMMVSVVLEPGAKSGEESEVSVSGGLAPVASTRHAISVSATPAAFGIEDYELVNEEADGVLDTQAGSHPFQQTTALALNTATANATSAGVAGLAKDLNFYWPPGLIGDPVPFQQCTLAEFFTNACPAQSVLGVAASVIDEPGVAGIADVIGPLANIEPAPGQIAHLGFLTQNTPVSIGATVRTGEDYGGTVEVDNIPQTITFLSSNVTVWGVPGEAAHDAARGEGCLLEARGVSPQEIIEKHYAPCRPLEETQPPPFLTLPSACTGALETSVRGDSWQEPKATGEQPTLAKYTLPALDGCNRLPFNPSITVTTEKTSASTPTGLTVDQRVPQESTLDAAGLAEADVKGLSVALPEGVTINPSAAGGLLSCSQAQIGLHSAAASSCPEASKIATVKIKTPVLANAIEGAAYIATQNENPFGSLMALYIYAEDPVSGVRVKAAGEVRQNPATGQLTTYFEQDPSFNGAPETSQFLPEAPVENIEVHFFGGERAALATPAHCGAYTTTGSFTPWSAQAADEAEVTVAGSSTFEVTSGPHGGSCPPASLPFTPTLAGGTTNINAGAFTPLVTTVSREDGDQPLSQIQVHTPEGIEGILTGVKLCPEAQANEGSCSPESLIGETTVSAGVGDTPINVTGGKVYLTEKFEGAPFGLSVVSPVKAGPFDLEHDTSNPANDPACDCLVVRARIEINPRTAELTVTSSHSGPHAIPRIIDGIPVQIKHVNVTVNREHFALDPTSCDPETLTGIIEGSEGAASPVSVPFQTANCSLLKFEPKVQVSTAAQASKANGAGVKFKISYPAGALGSQSWLNEVRFDIPKQLPSRLETLQKSCLATVFEHDRPNCPPAAIIGHVIVKTEAIPVPLEGPVYFVSYGNAKFPEAVMVLSGYGITIEQHGETFISKTTGITSATFRSIPDVPFENIEVNIPTGRYSQFGANLPPKDNYNFCGQKLTMPTLFKAQNGQEINQNTPITITGCKPKPTPAQQLQKALKACRKTHNHTKRTKCENTAHKKYNATTKHNKK